MNDKKEEILHIIHDLHARGIDQLNPEYHANDVVTAMFNVVLLGLRQTKNPDNFDAAISMFSDMAEQVKADLKKELASDQAN